MNNIQKTIKHFESLQKRYTTQHNGQMCERVNDALEALNYFQTSGQVRYGHWIEIIEDGKMKRVTSCCGDDQTKLTVWHKPDYCPRCGAKMDGGEDK